MEAVPSNIRQVITDMADTDKPLLSTNLADLSNIKPDELVVFDQIWRDIDLDRQRPKPSANMPCWRN